MRRLGVAIILLLGVLLAPPVQARDDELVVITSMSLKPSACPRATAEAVTFKTLLAAPERYRGRCVRISGLWVGRVLYRDLEGFYRARNSYPGPDIRATVQLGVYGSAEIMHREGSLRPAELVGKVNDCGDYSGVMMMGYCHSDGGPFIVLANANGLGPPVWRQTGEAARAAFGDLRPAPADWPERAEFEAIFEEWIADIRAGDVAAHWAKGKFADESNDDRWDDHHHRRTAMFGSRTSVFGRLRRAPAGAERAIFLAPPEPGIDAKDIDPREFRAVGCVCLVSGCNERWPISSSDADNLDGRPYVCLAMTRYVSRGGEVVTTTGAAYSEWGLPEPPHRP